MPAIRPRFVNLSALLAIYFLFNLLLSPFIANAANLVGLTVSPQNPTLNVSDSVQLTATGSYDDGTQQVIKQGKQVSAGNTSTCAVSTDGTVRCWGRNSSGQLGNGTTNNSSIPVAVPGISNALSVSAGGSDIGSHTCAALADGTLRCWGYNYFGQLGDGTTNNSLTPVTVIGISNAVSVSVGDHHACAMLVDGTLRCWGSNSSGVLGNGTTNNSTTPVAVIGISNAVSVSAGNYHTCAVLADGTLRCWGYNYYGQLGEGTTTDSPNPVAVPGISNAVSVSAGNDHTCAVLVDGTLRCWGSNRYGQLGNGAVNYSIPNPVAVMGISNAVSVSAGGSNSGSHTCATLVDGTLRCWGRNLSGQLGNSMTNDSSIPVVVPGISNAVSVSAGQDHTCTVLADGALWCWGYGYYGQLGNGLTDSSSLIPVTVIGISNMVSVSAGSYHTCATLADGTLRCWGDNSKGQLGNDFFSNPSYGTSITVRDISNAVSVSAGNGHTCAVLADGTLRCWGSNSSGQLGNGTTTNSRIPVIVSGISNASAVSAGFDYTCALLTDGTVQCWGGGSGSSSSIPVPVSGITNAVGVSAGGSSSTVCSFNSVCVSAPVVYACAVLADSTIKCWGDNSYGQLGNGTTTSSSIPVTVSGINNAISVDTNGAHTCALLADGTITCWGDNFYGQLSNNSPKPVSGISNAVAISAGGDVARTCDARYGCQIFNYGDSCAKLTDGTVRCWLSSPSLVPGIATAGAITVGGRHNCALLDDGTARCWGSNSSGQLGNGTAGASYSFPVQTLAYAPLLWGSSDPGVATVNNAGRVAAVAVGTAVITVSNNAVSTSTTVTVQTGIATTDLSVSLTDAPDPVLQGQMVTYNITVTNNGPSAATGVTVSGTLPACNIGNLASGASTSCTRTVTATAVGTLVQTLTVSGNETDLNSINNIASVSTTVNQSADLSLSLTDAPDPVLLGQTVTYDIVVTNNGPSYATDIIVSGILPVCSIGYLGPGTSAYCTRTATATTVGTLVQTIKVSGHEADPNSNNNNASVSTTVNPPSIDLELSITDAPDPVLLGQTVAYNITATNTGPSTATNVTATGTLPSCNLGTIAPGSSGTCSTTVTATTVGTLTQTMSVGATETDPNIANNTASVSTTVNPAADLTLSITDSPDPVDKGAKLTYTLTVKNNGPSTATNVSFTDTLPANIIFVSTTKTQGSCTGTTTVTCSLGTLNSGASATVKITIKPKTIGTLTNSASATASTGDPNTGNNSATVTTLVKR